MWMLLQNYPFLNHKNLIGYIVVSNERTAAGFSPQDFGHVSTNQQ